MEADQEVVAAWEALREHWLILLIMAFTTVANNIYNDIFVIRLSPFCCQVADKDDGLRIVSVHVEDWCVVAFAEIAAIWCRA